MNKNNMNEQIDFFEAKLRFEIDAFDLFTALNCGREGDRPDRHTEKGSV